MNSRDETLQEAYRLISDLWLSPQDIDRPNIENAGGKAVKNLKKVDEESAHLLEGFLRENAVSEEEYVDLFELNPQCPLYLGSHVYEEPKTCAQAGVSDRNGYMIDLLGIYKHFGLQPCGRELPDYFPSMMEFMALTVPSHDDPVRKKLIQEYILPCLPPVRSKLEELKTPYLHLLNACERILKFDESCNEKACNPALPVAGAGDWGPSQGEHK